MAARVCVKPPTGVKLLVSGAHWVRFVLRHRLEAVLAPAALEGAQLMAAADGQARLAAVGVADYIIGSVFTQPPMPARSGDEAVLVELQRAYIRGVQKNQPAGMRRADLDPHGLIVQNNRRLDLEGDAPGGALPLRGVRARLQQRF